jgi:Fur family zinc uptake transcriptional regulator
MEHAPGHQHAHPGSAGLRLAATSALESQGVAWTDLRACVFESLAAADRPVSAYDVSDAVSRRLGRRVAANSIYRILDLFVAHNLAKRIESRNAYVANVHPDCPHDCIFLVCSGCGAIDHLDDDSLAQTMRAHAAARGFAASRTVLEIEGLCRHCNA